MPEWKQNSALQAYRQGAQLAGLDGPGLSIRELLPGGKLLLQARGSPDQVSRLISPLLGPELPVKPNTSRMGNPAVLCLAPRKWLILLDSRRRELQRQLETALSAVPCLVSDLSDARTGIEVSGSQARILMARVCALDLDPRSFKPGRCAQSLLARAPLLLLQVDELPTYHLFVDRSLAAYAWEWLADAAGEFMARPIPA